MSSKRSADQLSDARQFKQTKLNFSVKAVRKEAVPSQSEREPEDQAAGMDGIDLGDRRLADPESSPALLLGPPSSPPLPPDEKAPGKSPEKQTGAADSACVTEMMGDLFDAPPKSVLIHACNCAGHWGAGIAAGFRERYPLAHKMHVAYCQSRTPDQLVGTAQLLPPSERVGAPQHYIGCLFTSRRFGRAKDSPSQILRATEPAMKDLIRQIRKLTDEGEAVGEIRMCKINSGLFAVPWEKTKELVESIKVEGGVDIAAWDREE